MSLDLTFNSGTLLHDMTVNALHDRVSGEGEEDFFLVLTTEDAGVQLSVQTANVTITDASKQNIERGPSSSLVARMLL